MDPAEMVNLHFHFGGEFFPGPRLEYIGGDEAISVVERDRLSLAEIKGYLNDHTVVKDSMKYYFPLPGKELKNGLIFLYEGSGCTKISDHINVGGVAEVYVEHHVEEEEHVSEDSDSDFEDEIGSMEGDSDAEHPHSVLTAGEDDEVDAPNSETLFAKGNSRKGHDVLWNGKDGFEVKHVSGRGRRYTVNLEKRTCSCGYFQLAGLPCCHAITAIYKCGKVIDDFIDKCYSIEEFKKIYEHCLEPVEGEEKWPISQNPRPEAPGYVRMPGRPKKNDRKREEGEAPKGKKMSKHGMKIKCGLCKTLGHNKTTCKKNPERGKKKNAFLAKTGRKTKASEQARTDAHVNASQQDQRQGKRKGAKEQNIQAKKKKANE